MHFQIESDEAYCDRVICFVDESKGFILNLWSVDFVLQFGSDIVCMNVYIRQNYIKCRGLCIL